MKIAAKYGFDFQREFCLYFERYDRAGLIDGNKKRFSHGKSIAGVNDGGGFRADDYGACERFRGQGAVFGVEA